MANQFHYTAKKRFGQNFLQDQSVVESILACLSIQPGDCVLEIGPGRGALTIPLLKTVGRLNVVEIDRDLAAALKNQFADNQGLSIYQEDALKFDLHQLESDSIQIVGNLPYNISTPLLFHLFAQIELIKSMTFMLQKEVVDRLCAEAGSSNYSRLTVMAQFYASIEKQFDVAADAFFPKPKVTSSVVRLLPKPMTSSPDQIAWFEKVVKQAFSQRRKTLKNNLKQWLSKADFAALELPPDCRAQELTVDDFIRLSNRIQNTVCS